MPDATYIQGVVVNCQKSNVEFSGLAPKGSNWSTLSSLHKRQICDFVYTFWGLTNPPSFTEIRSHKIRNYHKDLDIKTLKEIPGVLFCLVGL